MDLDNDLPALEEDGIDFNNPTPPPEQKTVQMSNVPADFETMLGSMCTQIVKNLIVGAIAAPKQAPQEVPQVPRSSRLPSPTASIEHSLARGTPRMATSAYLPRKKKASSSENSDSGDDPESSDPESSDSSSSSSPSSSSDSSASNHRARNSNVSNRPGRSKTRKSILQKLSEDADRPTNKVMITQTTPSFEHIRLDTITVSRVLKFVAQVHQYQLAYKISLPLATLIAEKPRRQIMARNKGLTLTKFFNLKTKKLIKLLMKEVRPESPLIFLKVVDRSVTFELPHAYRPSASEFMPLYNALLMYRNDFTMIVDVLSEKNTTNIPPVTNKEGGLIHLFLKKIPYDYGKHVMQTMKAGKYRNIHDFLRPFYKVVEQHKDDFTRTKSMNQFFSATLLMDAQPQAARRPSGFVKRHHVNEIAAVQEVLSDDGSEKSTDSRHHDDVVPDVSIPIDSENVPSSGDESDSSHHAAFENEEKFQQLDNIVKAPSRILQRSSAITPAKEAYKPPFKRDRETVCWVELFEGNCLNKNCPHSHDYAVLRKAHQQYSEKLQNSKYRLKPEAQRNVGTFNMIEIPVEVSANLGICDT